MRVTAETFSDVGGSRRGSVSDLAAESEISRDRWLVRECNDLVAQLRRPLPSHEIHEVPYAHATG
jgi:hypothetical protein